MHTQEQRFWCEFGQNKVRVLNFRAGHEHTEMVGGGCLNTTFLGSGKPKIYLQRYLQRKLKIYIGVRSL